VVAVVLVAAVLWCVFFMKLHYYYDALRVSLTYAPCSLFSTLQVYYYWCQPCGGYHRCFVSM